MQLTRRKPKPRDRVRFDNTVDNTGWDRYRIWTVVGVSRFKVMLTAPKIKDGTWDVTISKGRFYELGPEYQDE